MSLDFPLEGWPVGALRAIWHGTFGIVGSHVSRGAYRMSAPGFSVASHLAAISYREREAGNQDFFCPQVNRASMNTKNNKGAGSNILIRNFRWHEVSPVLRICLGPVSPLHKQLGIHTGMASPGAWGSIGNSMEYFLMWKFIRIRAYEMEM